MMHTTMLGAALACCAALPATAFDIQSMTEAERETFRAEIREYLLENPDVIMEAIAVLEQRREVEAAAAEDQMLVAFEDEIFNDGHSWVGGNPDGDITIVEFLDYQCGFCKRAQPVVESLLESDGNIRLVVKEFPILGPGSVLGSQYALAVRKVAGDEAYKQVHDALMGLRGQVNEGALAKVSEDLLLDHDEILARMDDPEIGRIITENRALAQNLDIQGTPTFVFEDRFVRGFLEGPQMEALIEDIRAGRG